MADQFTGKNLVVTIGAVTLTCPQSFEVSGQHEFVEYYCTASADKQKIYDGTSWTASATFFPEDNDHADLTALTSATAVACSVYPDGNSSGKIAVTFNAFPSMSSSVQRGSPGSATVNLIIDGDVTFADVTP